MRAEPWFIESLARNPFLQRFIPDPKADWPPPEGSPIQVLESIFLDTASLRIINDLPTKVGLWLERRRRTVTSPKEEATADLVQMMELFDPSTKFFLNTWTWGYEDVLKAVARRFNSRVRDDSIPRESFAYIS